MSKHTPGPWYWSPDYKTGDGRATWSLIGSDGYGILSCDGEENSPQGLGLSGGANARLIAAAPDLLAACEQALVELEDSLPPPSDEWDFYDKLKSAIAKAKGGAA